jgi:hypothetical protein
MAARCKCQSSCGREVGSAYFGDNMSDCAGNDCFLCSPERVACMSGHKVDAPGICAGHLSQGCLWKAAHVSPLGGLRNPQQDSGASSLGGAQHKACRGGYIAISSFRHFVKATRAYVIWESGSARLWGVQRTDQPFGYECRKVHVIQGFFRVVLETHQRPLLHNIVSGLSNIAMDQRKLLNNHAQRFYRLFRNDDLIPDERDVWADGLMLITKAPA